MLEFQILAQMADSHLSMSGRLQRMAQDMIGNASRDGISPEEKKKLEEQAKEYLMQASMFKQIYTEELKACDMANKKFIRTMESHYQPIKALSRKPLAGAKPQKPQPEKPSMPTPGAKCDKCKEPAVLSKDGKNCCRIHYSEVFPDKKDDVPKSPMAPPSMPPPAPPTTPAV